MKKIYNLARALFAVAFIAMAVAACNTMPVGFLRTEGASFSPDTLNVYHNPHASTLRYNDHRPWVSYRIQGVAGTNPINFELADVKATEGGDAEKFKALAQKGLLKVDGGMIVLMHEGVAELPNSGRYTLSLRVYNDGHSQTISDVYTIIVGVDEPKPEQQNP
ncbi:hypothetical protein HMPREF2955_05845 [Prevotella sp. HMSC073D09]|uniref:hypothetical protein n=1 Tax=Prevotella sp. HMSC073D09 TaxID=1739459 RepID=UPI0008A1F86B|nr:hypothetical protein [Prevotella sp. HMSC073D09]OFQ25608.1 hypothetical protein HMPREF2955_05845 [Prevotella sp. HMSC073D09]